MTSVEISGRIVLRFSRRNFLFDMVAQKRFLGNSIVKFLRSRSLTPMKHEVSVKKVLSREWIMSSFLQALREQPRSRVVEYAIVATGVAIAIAMVSIFQQFQ